jgi:serine/threonine-protein kinase HipA
MSLWWLADPSTPMRIGELFLADGYRKVGLRYDPAWLRTGFALSEDMPLLSSAIVPVDLDSAAGAVNDARPDQWGARVIRMLEKPTRLSILEYLYFAGQDRFGALGVSLHSDRYDPCSTSPLPTSDNLSAIQSAIHAFIRNDPVSEVQSRLLRPGASLGGARPKSIIKMDGIEWVVKFSEDDTVNTPLIEHATMLFAMQCGIRSASTRALPIGGSGMHAVAVRRFDRIGEARLHVLSAKAALSAAGEPMGYPQLAQLLRRLASPTAFKQQQEELFRRMVFNILMDNSDDHEQNHALVHQTDGHYELSPAFDVVPTMQGLGYQQMQVGINGAESTLENALSQADEFGLSRQVATQITREIAGIIETSWKSFFAEVGVSPRDIDTLARYIDKDALRLQRESFVDPAVHPVNLGDHC